MPGKRDGLLGFLDRVAAYGSREDGGALVRKLDAEFLISAGR